MNLALRVAAVFVLLAVFLAARFLGPDVVRVAFDRVAEESLGRKAVHPVVLMHRAYGLGDA